MFDLVGGVRFVFQAITLKEVIIIDYAQLLSLGGHEASKNDRPLSGKFYL
jgi:hypothetical protein